MSLTALLLGLCQFFFMAAAAVSFSFTGLVGENLAGTSALATLPFLAMTATTAMLTLGLPRWFGRFGYKRVFVVGCVAGAAGAFLSGWAIVLGSFVGFCLAAIGFGIYQASALYYRFAAAEAAPAEAKGRAVAWVMTGGIPAAFAGPLIGAQVLHLLPVAYTGAYVAAALLALMAIPILLIARLPLQQAVRQPLANPITPQPASLSLAQSLRHPNALAAIVFCVSGYATMLLVMLAAPLAMSAHHHAAADVASVIQWHLLGMFVPSLLTGKLIDRWGAKPIALAGCLLLAGGCAVALGGTELSLFHIALLLVGVGWNLTYMGGTTLITHVGETAVRARLQALNESATFGTMTLIAGIAGWVYHGLGWPLLLTTAICLIVAVALGLSAISGRRQRLPV